jgi:hypothetical protein
MAKKTFITNLGSFFKKESRAAAAGIKKAGQFVEHEKQAFSEWQKQHRKDQIVRHKKKLAEQRSKFKEQYEVLSEQRALQQLKTDIERERMQNQQARMQLKMEREQYRQQHPGAVRKIGGFLREVYKPSPAQLQRERIPSRAERTSFTRSTRPRIKSRAEILAEIDARARR